MTFPAPVRVSHDAITVLYLLLVAVLLPLAAIRSRAVLTPEGLVVPAPLRAGILARAVALQIVIFAASLFVARRHALRLWPSPRLGGRELAVGAAALLTLLGVGLLSWRLRSAAERRHLWVRHLLPDTPAQWGLWLAVSIAAGIAEETTYRGVLVVLLGSVTASLVVGALLSAVVFALLHFPQGRTSMALVFAIALVMQGVVSMTGTLYVAIGVHAVYDITAGIGVWHVTRNA
jgi:membrane protease YdiL (CAAX protease family)